VVQTISHRVIRKLRSLGYLEAGGDAAVTTGYDPLVEDAPALARTLAASVQQRIAFGERAGQKVRRLGAGFGSAGEAPMLTGPHCASVQGFSVHAHTQVPAHRRDELERLIRYTARGAVSLERLAQDANGDLVYTFTHPSSDGTTGIRLTPLELLEKLAALIPLPHSHLVRYGGCLAPHSHLRGCVLPTPRQQDMDGEAQPGTPYWPWARLLGRVFGLEMSTCPFCRRGSLRIIAVITQGEVISKILRHLKLAADPPPIAPAVVTKHRSTGCPKPTASHVGSSAPCAPRRGIAPLCTLTSRVQSSPPGFPQLVVPRPSHRETPEPHLLALSRRARLLHNHATPCCAPLLRVTERALKTLPSPRARSRCRRHVARGAGRKGRLIII
jgi:Putative transposase